MGHSNNCVLQSKRFSNSLGRNTRLIFKQRKLWKNFCPGTYHTSPDRISEQELQRYCLHRKNVDGLAPASMRICYSGIRFFSQHVLKRDWHTLALIRPQTAHRLPAVLSVEEVQRLLKIGRAHV